MLNEEEKARIRAEEIFRSEIRRELETHMPPPSRRERLWLLLNSSFALWFLSSIVLAGLTTGFAYYESWRRGQERKVEIERRLDTEISSRIESALYGLRADKVRIDQGEVYAPRWIYSNTQSYLDNFFVADPSNPRDFSIYPEYQKRNFRALIYELRSSVDPSLRPELTDALTSYEQLLNLGSTENDKAKDKSESLEAVEKAFEFVDSKLRKSRWREPR